MKRKCLIIAELKTGGQLGVFKSRVKNTDIFDVYRITTKKKPIGDPLKTYLSYDITQSWMFAFAAGWEAAMAKA